MKTLSTPRSLPPVTGTVRVLRPVGSVGPRKNQTGEISIATETGRKTYYVRVRQHSYELYGRDEATLQNTLYEIPASLDECPCKDWVYNAQRRPDKLCRHCKSISALIAAGKLPQLECVPARVDDLADADEGYGDDSEADAWHSQFDAA